MSEPQRPERATAPSRGAHCALAAGMVLTLLLRIPAFQFPLDQDCGEYSYCAMRWAAGGLPYRDVWDHKPPLIYLAYRGIFAVTGSAPAIVAPALRVGAMLCDAATALALFALVRRLFGAWPGVAAAAAFGLFSGMPGMQLEAFQPERLTTLFAVLGLLAASSYVQSWRYRHAALAGLLLGLGIAAKQIVAPIGLLAWAWVSAEALRAYGRQAWGRVAAHSGLMAAGAVLPWAVFAGYFALRGAFADFWECTYTYNVLYATEHRKGALLDQLRRLVMTKLFDHAFLWLTAAAGIILALRRPAERRGGLVVLGWVLAAFLGLFLPGQFAHYYYLPTLAPLAAASAVALAALWQWGRAPGLRRLVAAGLGVVLLAMGAFAAKRGYGEYKLTLDPDQPNQVIARLARELAAKTAPSDHIFLFGGRPQIYALAGRPAPTKYLFNFSYQVPLAKAFLFQDAVRAEIMAGLRRHQPRFVIVAITEKRELDGFPELAQCLAGQYDEQPEWRAKVDRPHTYTLRIFRRKAAS